MCGQGLDGADEGGAAHSRAAARGPWAGACVLRLRGGPHRADIPRRPSSHRSPVRRAGRPAEGASDRLERVAHCVQITDVLALGKSQEPGMQLLVEGRQTHRRCGHTAHRGGPRHVIDTTAVSVGPRGASLLLQPRNINPLNAHGPRNSHRIVGVARTVGTQVRGVGDRAFTATYEFSAVRRVPGPASAGTEPVGRPATPPTGVPSRPGWAARGQLAGDLVRSAVHLAPRAHHVAAVCRVSIFQPSLPAESRSSAPDVAVR